MSLGFWNTIWSEANCSGVRLWTAMPPRSAPSSRTSPSVAVSRPISTLAKVDLPHPDSPTMATVSPSPARKLMLSLALTWRTDLPETMAASDLSFTS